MDILAASQIVYNMFYFDGRIACLKRGLRLRIGSLTKNFKLKSVYCRVPVHKFSSFGILLK
jgi:hypothetical protein